MSDGSIASEAYREIVIPLRARRLPSRKQQFCWAPPARDTEGFPNESPWECFSEKRRHCDVTDGYRPFSPHFNLSIEFPLKAIVRGFPWRNRPSGVAKLELRAMGIRYLFICFYVWQQKYFSGDYKKKGG